MMKGWLANIARVKFMGGYKTPHEKIRTMFGYGHSGPYSQDTLQVRRLFAKSLGIDVHDRGHLLCADPEAVVAEKDSSLLNYGPQIAVVGYGSQESQWGLGIIVVDGLNYSEYKHNIQEREIAPKHPIRFSMIAHVDFGSPEETLEIIQIQQDGQILLSNNKEKVERALQYGQRLFEAIKSGDYRPRPAMQADAPALV